MFNCVIEDENEEQIKCRDALRHFFNSPLWQNIVESLRKIRAALFEGGYAKFAETFVDLMDPSGEKHAMKVLGVPLGTTDEAVRRAYRELSKKYHPDKNPAKTPEERELIERKFREVQEAFEVLQMRRSKRVTLDSSS